MAGSITLGANVDPAFFAQHQAEVLDPTAPCTKSSPSRRATRAQPAHDTRRVRLQRRRGRAQGARAVGRRTHPALALAKVMANPVNLLVLDEPTNHLDLQSCDVLEDALSAYPGTVLLVTHDRYLIRTVADAVIEVRNGRACWHDGVDENLLSAQPMAAPRSKGRHGAEGR